MFEKATIFKIINQSIQEMFYSAVLSSVLLGWYAGEEMFQSIAKQETFGPDN